MGAWKDYLDQRTAAGWLAAHTRRPGEIAPETQSEGILRRSGQDITFDEIRAELDQVVISPKEITEFLAKREAAQGEAARGPAFFYQTPGATLEEEGVRAGSPFGILAPVRVEAALVVFDEALAAAAGGGDERRRRAMARVGSWFSAAADIFTPEEKSLTGVLEGAADFVEGVFEPIGEILETVAPFVALITGDSTVETAPSGGAPADTFTGGTGASAGGPSGSGGGEFGVTGGQIGPPTLGRNGMARNGNGITARNLPMNPGFGINGALGPGAFFYQTPGGQGRARSIIRQSDWNGNDRYWVGGRTLPKAKIRQWLCAPRHTHRSHHRKS